MPCLCANKYKVVPVQSEAEPRRRRSFDAISSSGRLSSGGSGGLMDPLPSSRSFSMRSEASLSEFVCCLTPAWCLTLAMASTAVKPLKRRHCRPHLLPVNEARVHLSC